MCCIASMLPWRDVSWIKIWVLEVLALRLDQWVVTGHARIRMYDEYLEYASPTEAGSASGGTADLRRRGALWSSLMMEAIGKTESYSADGANLCWRYDAARGDAVPCVVDCVMM